MDTIKKMKELTLEFSDLTRIEVLDDKIKLYQQYPSCCGFQWRIVDSIDIGFISANKYYVEAQSGTSVTLKLYERRCY